MNEKSILQNNSETIRMVKETLLKMSEYPTKNRLWRALPRQIQYSPFKKILKNLEESNKLITDKDGSLVWIFAGTPEQKKLREETKPLL